MSGNLVLAGVSHCFLARITGVWTERVMVNNTVYNHSVDFIKCIFPTSYGTYQIIPTAVQCKSEATSTPIIHFLWNPSTKSSSFHQLLSRVQSLAQ